MISPITSMQNAFRLDGKNAVITGGNRGLGFGIATAMAQSGANIAILCRDRAKAAEAIAELKQYGTRCAAFGFHLYYLYGLAENVLSACGFPFIHAFGHGGRRGYGVDRRYFGKRVCYVSCSRISIHREHSFLSHKKFLSS